MVVEQFIILLIFVGFMCLIFGLGAWISDVCISLEEEKKLKEEVKAILHRYDDMKSVDLERSKEGYKKLNESLK
jgi:hypothetical protein